MLHQENNYIIQNKAIKEVQKGKSYETNRQLKVKQTQIHHINNIICEWIKEFNQKAEIIKIDENVCPNICCLQDTHYRLTETIRLKVKEWETVTSKYQ